MPYESIAQSRFMHARHPGIAKRWDREFPDQSHLPKRKKKVRYKPKRVKRAY